MDPAKPLGLGADAALPELTDLMVAAGPTRPGDAATVRSLQLAEVNR